MLSNTILPHTIELKYEREIQFIRKCATLGNIKISDHCYQQLAVRKIRISDVYESVRKGVVLEVQNKDRDIKVLFQDAVNMPPSFFSVVAVKSAMALFVTAHFPNSTKWYLDKGKQWRRK